MDATKHAQPKQPEADTTGSPAMRIYRHALESIFAMLDLADLSCALAVCREWSAAVRSMSPLGAVIERIHWQWQTESTARPLPPIDTLVASPLLRHIAAIHIKIEDEDCLVACTPLTSESFALLAQHAPNLTSLWCDLTLTPGVPLILPAKLSSLELELGMEFTGADINGVLTALAALPSLSRLRLRMFDNHDVDLSLLAVSRSLMDLTLEGLVGRLPPLSDAHVEQIRSSLGHLARFHVVRMDRADLPRLLRPPVTARWQDIGFVCFASARTGDLLVSLPTLTTLKLHYRDDAPHADFLSKLPLLSALKLHCRWSISAAPLLASLLPCTGLTELDLQCAFDSSQVSTLLAALTNLRRLTLDSELETLQCFASGPGTHALEELHLVQWGNPLPPSQLVHLYAMQALRSLELEGVFASLDADAMASLTPPTADLTRLTRFAHCTQGLDRVERTGPSFEWTQQRLTQ